MNTKVVIFLAVVAVAVCAPTEEEAAKQKRHVLAYPGALAAPGVLAAPLGWNGAYPYPGAWNGAYPYAGAWNGAFLNPVSNVAYTINPFTGLPVRVDTPWTPSLAPASAPIISTARPIVAV